MNDADAIRACLIAFVDARQLHFHALNNALSERTLHEQPFRSRTRIDLNLYRADSNDSAYLVLGLNFVRTDNISVLWSVSARIMSDCAEISGQVDIERDEDWETVFVKKQHAVSSSEIASAIKTLAAEVCAQIEHSATGSKTLP
jgi:hypothetical protein